MVEHGFGATSVQAEPPDCKVFLILGGLDVLLCGIFGFCLFAFQRL